MLPEIPDLATLTDEQLASLLAEVLAVVDQIENGEVGDDVSLDEQLEIMAAAAAAAQAIRAESEARETAASEAAERMADLARQARGTTEDDGAQDDEAAEDESEDEEPVAEGDEDAEAEPAEVVEEALPVAAAARPATPARRPAPRRSAAHAPRQTPVRQRAAVVAAADVPDVPAGSPLEGLPAVARAMASRWDAFRGSSSSRGEERIPVARIRYRDLIPNQIDDNQDAAGNWRRISDVVGDEAMGYDPETGERNALVAAGGLCAPRTPLYDLQLLSEDMRPVRAALPRFGVTRGGIRFMTPPSLGAITTAVTRITAAQDAAGGTSAQKGCQTIACPPISEVDVAAIAHCLQFGNMGARSFPEQIENAVALTMAAHARVAETALLDAMAAASITATTPAVGGVIATLLPQVLLAATAMRSRHRMDPNRVLRAMFPQWVADLLVADMTRAGYDRFTQNRAGLLAFFRENNIEVTFYVDSPTGGGMVFGAQTSGAVLLSWPSTVKWFLFPEGTFVVLDGGEMDLGVVRDSTLNASNNFQMFGEIWENLAFVGIESLLVTSTVCPTGVTAGTTSFTCPIL